MARRTFHCSTNQNSRNKRRGYSLCYKDKEKTLKGIEPPIVELKPTEKLVMTLASYSYNWVVSWMAHFGETAKSQVRWLVRMSLWLTQDLQFWVRTAALSEKKKKKKGEKKNGDTKLSCAGCVRINQPIISITLLCRLKESTSFRTLMLIFLSAC